MATGHRDLIAYLRVSSEAQDTQLQRDALGEAGCVSFFQDKISSLKADRTGLAAALEYLRRGDTLVVWKLDRLGLPVKEVLTIADELHEHRIGLRILTGTLAAGSLHLHGMLVRLVTGCSWDVAARLTTPAFRQAAVTSRPAA